MKKTPLQKLMYPIITGLLLLLLAVAQQSCKKTNESISSAAYSPQTEKFLDLPYHPDPDLQPVIADLKNQLAKTNFANDFINWHGQPLWDKAVKVVGGTANEKHVTFYIPTKKEAEKNIAAFFIVDFYKGHFYYELHRRSMLDKPVKEPTIFSHSKRDYARILAYFTYSILGVQDTVAVAYPGDLEGGKYQAGNKILSEFCWSQTEPCSGNKATDGIYHPQCFFQTQDCIFFEGGGNGGGSGLPGDVNGGGGGGNPEPNPVGCPDVQWYDLEYEPCVDEPGEPINELPDPCEQADDLENNTGFKEKFTVLKSKTNQTREYGYVYKINSPATINSIEMEGEINAAGIEFTPIEKMDGFIHSHYTGLLSVFSPNDIYSMAQIYLNNKMVDPFTFTAGVVTANGTQYILKIDDVYKFKAFAENMVNNNTLDTYSFIYETLYKITPQNTKEQNEKAFLQYIQQSNSGLRLFKGTDSFNNWQPKKVDDNGNIVNNPC